MKTVFAAIVLCLMAAVASAQDSVIDRARALPRPEGIRLLASHLATTPNDVDARLVYGLLLSWEGRYDDAREALQQVLAKAPDYFDAHVALMNVEWWSGRRVEARRLVNLVLSQNPGQPQARRVQQRLDAKDRPFSVGVGYTGDTFDDGREAWSETGVTLGVETPAGTLFARGSTAERFGLSDRLYEIEFYPTFRPGTTGYIEVGRGETQKLYPTTRMAVDLYQDLGHGVEGSIGYRRLHFTDATHIYVATLSKYAGPWLLTGRVFVSPNATLGASQSYHAQVRRYFGVAASRGRRECGRAHAAGRVRLSLGAGVGELTADRDRVVQALVNLLGNAVKFSRAEVRLAVTSERGGVSFSVIDRGEGMTHADVDTLFQPFTQLSAGARVGGTGLGLTITRLIVEQHGGTITVDSTPGQGSTFTIWLPGEPRA